MRSIALAYLIVGAVCCPMSDACAQKASGSADGRRFAEMWCSGCHAVELRMTRSGGIAPDFSTIVNRGSTTRRSLRVYLSKRHEKMPNFVLDKEDADDVVDFLMSLKQR